MNENRTIIIGKQDEWHTIDGLLKMMKAQEVRKTKDIDDKSASKMSYKVSGERSRSASM
jgi:hypothetical protein